MCVSISTGPLSGGSAGFAAGARVEARYGGEEEWYAGRIRAARDDGTYDVEYDDGDLEERVAVDLVRSAP